ncbi:peptidoglycan-binding protein [Oscillospiraceae bacterium LCP25S3_E10]|nr:peptidoglycan-binding protein [Ruminococcus sp.]MDD6447256.1 peptidoglycan-binding protein [Ruminococcus sp.]MDY2855803.1 peptidoglycan-binding protein [Oscillospiraceae bacterium]
MLRKILAISLCAITLAAAAGCNNFSTTIDKFTGNQEEYPVNVGHNTITTKPQKIAVLDDNVADILIACGYSDKIVAKTKDCNQEELKNVKEYGTDAKPDTASINKLNPNVVFTTDSIEYSYYKSMADSDTVVLRIKPASDIKELKLLYKNLCRVMEGSITGEKSGEKFVNKVLKSMEAVKSKNNVVKGCYLFKLDDKSAVTTDMFANTILEYAGVQNIAVDTDKNGAMPISRIIAADKQEGFAFYVLCEKGLKNKILQSDEFKSSNVVNKNRIVEIPSVYLTRQGNTAVQGIKYIESQLAKQKQVKGESLTEDYGIELYDGISYSLDDQDYVVLALQQRLDDLGYLPINPTGFYGDSTASAVKEFQVNNELNRRDGVADYETLERLFSTAAYSRSTPIKESTNSTVQAQGQVQATEPATFEVTVE